MSKFVLASASPRRKELLENIGLEFEIIVSEADESVIDRSIAPDMLVKELAMLKAAEAAKYAKKDSFVIGADTVVVYDGQVLEKPADSESAEGMLKMLSGKEHCVYTGVCIFNTNDCSAICKSEKTVVSFKELSEETVKNYVKTGEPMDKAGSYGIQGKGALLIKGIEGDYFNVVGLPLGLLSDMFKEEYNIEIL